MTEHDIPAPDDRAADSRSSRPGRRRRAENADALTVAELLALHGRGAQASAAAGPGEPAVADGPVAPDAVDPAVPESGSPEPSASDRPAVGLAAVDSDIPTEMLHLPPAGAATEHRAGHRWLMAGRVLVAAVAVVVLAAVGIEWRILAHADAVIAKNDGNYLKPDDSNIIEPTKPTATVDSVGSTVAVTKVAAPVSYPAENILVLGSDTRAGDNGNGSNMGADTVDSAQSDTMMLVHLAENRTRISVMALPRDMYVEAPICKAWDFRTGKLHDYDYENPFSQIKLTNAYSIGGPTCTIAAIQKLTGIKIDRMIGIDFVGFKAMVDAIDGITINACAPIIDAELGPIITQAGVQTVFGDTALNLVRARKASSGNLHDDYARIHRQQVVLSTVLKQVTSAGTLINPFTQQRVVDAAVQNTFTDNVSAKYLLGLAASFGDLGADKVNFFTLPTVSADGDVNPGPEADAIFAAIRNDELLPGEEGAVATSSSAAAGPTVTAPKTTTVPTTGETSSEATGDRPTTSGSLSPTSEAPKSTPSKSTAPKSTAPKSTAPKSTAPKSAAPTTAPPPVVADVTADLSPVAAAEQLCV